MEYFAEQTVNSYGESVYALKPLGYAALILLCLLLLLFALHFTGRKNKAAARQLVFSSAAIALALVFSEIRLFKMPLGGSVTLCSMLFIVLVGNWFGPEAGLMTGVSHGIIQLLLNPCIYSLPQLLMDYPLSFGALGLGGFFRKKKHGLLIGYLVSVFGRFVFSFLSGWIYFADYAPEGWNVIWYSAAYNFAYLAAEAALTAVLISLPPLARALRMVEGFARGENLLS